jgi:hypothetical protein
MKKRSVMERFVFCLFDKGLKEGIIKIKVVAVNNHLTSKDFRRKGVNALKRTTFHFLLTVAA